MIIIKNSREIALMRESGEIVAKVLEMIGNYIKEGISTYEIDRLCEDMILSLGATPSFKNYNGFKGSVCTSLNDVVVHGIPSNTEILKSGDIISVDVGAYKNGFHGDAARTFSVGDVSSKAKELIKITEESFFEGIKYAKEGYRLGDISNAIQRFVEDRGYSIVRDFTGHGIGESLHEDPAIPNYGAKGSGVLLKRGMTLAIEPMVTSGDFKVMVLPDNWTTKTRDGSLSSHYENTILITENEAEILTLI